MNELISGKEALTALGSGEEVEVRVRFPWGSWGNWMSLTDIPEISLADILVNKFDDQFRLKPRTIKLNIEIEKPKEIVLCEISCAVALVYEDLEKAKTAQKLLREVFK